MFDLIFGLYVRCAMLRMSSLTNFFTWKKSCPNKSGSNFPANKESCQNLGVAASAILFYLSSDSEVAVLQIRMVIRLVLVNMKIVS